MPKIYSYIETQQATNNVGSLFDNADNQFNNALGGLPSGPGSPGSTDTGTDIIITTDLTTDYAITTDLTTDYVITTDLSTDIVLTTDLSTDYVITTDTDIVVSPTDEIVPTDIPTTDILTDLSTDTDNTIIPPPPAIDARDYEVFAAVWGNTDVNALSVVPMVFMSDSWNPNWYDWKFYIGPCSTDISDDTISELYFNKFKTNLERVPEGRRVLKPYYWLLQSPQGGITDKSNAANPYFASNIQDLYYHDLDGGSINKDGQEYKYLGPWYYNNTNDVKESVKDFLQRCKAENLTFDYIADSPENYGRDGIWWVGQRPENVYTWVRNIGGSEQQANIVAYSGLFNPHKLEGIINDTRFNTEINPLTNKTAFQEFYESYSTILTLTNEIYGGSSRLNLRWWQPSSTWFTPPGLTAQEIFSPLFGYDPYPIQNSGTNATTRAWSGVLMNWMVNHRNNIWASLTETNYENVKVSMYGAYPLNAEETPYVIDYNGGNWAGHGAPIPDNFTVTPQLYGWAGALLQNLAYITNPLNDYEKYVFALVVPAATLPPGYQRYDSGAWLAFITDVQWLRGTMRSYPSGWQKLTPWIPSPTIGVGEGFQYSEDIIYGSQYWKEMILHCCIFGTTYFNVLGGDTSSSQIPESIRLHNILDEWRNISGNSKCRPITTEKIAIGSSVLISGGQLLKSGKYIWRITAKASTTLNRFVQYNTNRSDIPQIIDIPNGSRGVWLLTNSSEPPIYALTTRPQDDDGDPEPPPSDTLYAINFDYQYRTPNLFRMKALYGGNQTHDFGSGIGINEEGQTSGAINYLVSAGIKTQFQVYENDSLYQYTYYHDLDERGIPINYEVETNVGVMTTITSSGCSVGEPCYNSEPLASKWFREEMSENGEWGLPLRQQQPYPNNQQILENCVLPYTRLSSGIVTQPSYNNTKPTDMLWNYTNEANSFWNRSTAQGGRSDLAYTYSGEFKSGYEYPVWKDDVLTPVTNNAGSNYETASSQKLGV